MPYSDQALPRFLSLLLFIHVDVGMVDVGERGDVGQVRFGMEEVCEEEEVGNKAKVEAGRW